MLSKIFLHKKDDPNDPAVRARCGRNAGIFGIVLNTLLAAGKIIVGSVSGAISVTADGLNNLTDCGSNVLSVIGFKMSENLPTRNILSGIGAPNRWHLS